jgi:hypothetical protein
VIITTVRRLSIISTVFLSLFAVSGQAKDTPLPADGQCDYVNYYHHEKKNAQCTSDCDCDGTRSCVSGKCSGTARPKKLTAEVCNNKDYHYQEKWTAKGEVAAEAGKCSGDCECDGLRTCASGECSGTAR